MAAYRSALRHGIALIDIAEEYWKCLMLAGRFAAAWTVSDAVLRRRAGLPESGLPYHVRQVWDGTPLAGRKVLLRCFHGLGDTLQFIRFVPRLRRLAADLVVEAQPELIGLLRSVPGIGRIVPLGAGDAEPHEVAIESMEVPHALRLRLAELPGPVPYLWVEQRRGTALPRDGRRRVGLVWEAGGWDPRRSLPVSSFRPLAEMPGLALFRLQRGPALGAFESGASAAPRFDAGGTTSDDVVATAAAILQLDLVITVDTAATHLEGALGARVWTLLPFAADWRWLAAGRRSPWYPSMRLFRQERPGDWQAPLAELFRRLRSGEAWGRAPGIQRLRSRLR